MVNSTEIEVKSPEEHNGLENLKTFILLSEKDEKLKIELSSLALNDIASIICYGQRFGYAFNENDIEELGIHLLGQVDELSEEELEQMANRFWLQEY